MDTVMYSDLELMVMEDMEQTGYNSDFVDEINMFWIDRLGLADGDE
jgi:hypothetical protein